MDKRKKLWDKLEEVTQRRDKIVTILEKKIAESESVVTILKKELKWYENNLRQLHYSLERIETKCFKEIVGIQRKLLKE